MGTNAKRQELILMNLRLAYKIAWEYFGCGIEQEELQAAALFGLVKAASEYDSSRGAQFPTFASAVIHNTIRLEFRKVRKNERCVSMEETISGLEEGRKNSTWAERILCRETGFDQVEREDFIPSLLLAPELTKKEQKTVWLVVCNGMTQKEAGQRMGLSQSYVSRQIRSGIKKIRKKYMEVMYPAGI